MRNLSTQEDLAAYLRDLSIRLERQERHTHMHWGEVPEVTVIVPEPEPEPEPEPGCVPWLDDFERADGPLGPTWVQAVPSSPTGIGGYGTFYIASGAMEAPMNLGLGARMYWSEVQEPDQVIEIVVANAMGNNGYFQLLTNANLTDRACQGLEVNFYDRAFPWTPPPATGDILNLNLFRQNSTGGYTFGEWWQIEPYPPTEPVTIRLESWVDGTQRVYVNGALVLTAIDGAPVTGDYVGVLMQPSTFGDAYDSPRVLSVTGGCMEPIEPVTLVAARRTGATTGRGRLHRQTGSPL